MNTSRMPVETRASRRVRPQSVHDVDKRTLRTQLLRKNLDRRRDELLARRHVQTERLDMGAENPPGPVVRVSFMEGPLRQGRTWQFTRDGRLQLVGQYAEGLRVGVWWKLLTDRSKVDRLVYADGVLEHSSTYDYMEIPPEFRTMDRARLSMMMQLPMHDE